MNNMIDASRQPVVTTKNGEVFTNSRDVAAFFGKEHRGVLRDVDNLIKSEPDLGLHNFVHAPYRLQSTGDQLHRSFEMNRDGFTLLAMGFTGAKAIKWKLRYIEAFNAMEAELRHRSSSAIPDFSDPAVLVPLLTNYAMRTQIAEQKVTELTPKAEAFDLLEGSEGAVNIREAAKILNVSERKFTAWLEVNRWAYRINGVGPLQGYVDKRNARYLDHRPHTYFDRGREVYHTVAQMLVTPKGLAKLSQIFAKHGSPK